MFNILDFGLWARISYGIVKSLYGTCIRVYDIMIELAKNSSILDATAITANLYVLAVVFMLFRVAIGLIKMLITPDAINDKQAGAGKMITRVVVSIIMLIVFSPTGILFNKDADTPENDGFLPRIERALISDKKSLLYTAFTVKEVDDGNATKEDPYGKKTIVVQNVASPFYTYFFEDVEAENTETSCYFYRKQTTKSKGKIITVQDPIKIKFTTTKPDGSEGTVMKVKNTDGFDMWATIYSKEETKLHNSEGDELEFNYNSNIKDISASTTVPKKNGKGSNGKSLTGPIKKCSNWIIYKDNNNKVFLYRNVSDNFKKNNDKEIYRGYDDFQKLYNVAKDDWQKINKNKLADEYKDLIPEWAKILANGNRGYSEAGIAFGTNLISCFEECIGDDTTDCEEEKSKQFDTYDNKAMKNMIKDNEMDLSFMIAVIAGVALIIYLLVLCVEIVIRSLKLMLLETLAPIPIVSYIDPKDKIFNQWIKMLMGTYADLFIKIFSINLGINLLNVVFNSETLLSGNLFKRFLVIVGILVFMKMIPSIISKIFGIDSLGGSFKDIVGMGKKALGFGTGAVIGGAVGAVTGGFGGMLRGLGRGAGAGVKGNFTGNASGIADYNRNLKFSKAAGSTAGGRLLTRLGINDYEAQKRKNDIEKVNLAESKAKALEAIQRRRTANDNTLSNIAGFEKRVEGQFDKHRYDGKGIQEVEAYRAASAELSAARTSGNAARIKAAEDAASAAKGNALDAVKQYEIDRGANGDSEAQAYLATLDQSVVAQGFKNGIDAQKKSITADNVSIKNDISQLDISYTAKEQALAAKERALENSASKANFDAVKNLDKK